MGYNTQSGTDYSSKNVIAEFEATARIKRQYYLMTFNVIASVVWACVFVWLAYVTFFREQRSALFLGILALVMYLIHWASMAALTSKPGEADEKEAQKDA